MKQNKNKIKDYVQREESINPFNLREINKNKIKDYAQSKESINLFNLRETK